MARDQVIEEPTVVHPLLRIVDENQSAHHRSSGA